MSGLERFVEAQAGIYPKALSELRAGRKHSHWMWFIFPQITGLGHSDMARFYAIKDRDEAVAFLSHDLLGQRLRECCEAVSAWAGKRSAVAILGTIDAMKLHSSMTLFAAVATDAAPFDAIIEAFYDGKRDTRTLELLT